MLFLTPRSRFSILLLLQTHPINKFCPNFWKANTLWDLGLVIWGYSYILAAALDTCTIMTWQHSSAQRLRGATAGLYSEQTGRAAKWGPAGSDIIMLCVVSGQGGNRSEFRGVFWGCNLLIEWVCVCLCVCVSALLVVCLCLRESVLVYLCFGVCVCVCVCVCGGLACLSSPLAVIRRDTGSMTSHYPHHHPLRERLSPFHPVMCVWLPVLGPWRYVRS